MHKNRLQELCHKQMWDLPAYTSCRDGPDHNPRFRASVVVNGHTFDAPDLSKSAKEAQNKAAEVALGHLSAVSSSPAPSHPTGDAPPLSRSVSDVQLSYKTQLQIYVQKRNIGVLKYDSVRAGSAHALRFKARVTVDGQTFESSEYFKTLREAEHSAARVALMSLPHEENHQDEPNFYKNLLQQLVQKEGLSLPSYNTLFNGISHMPIFTCTVVVEGESFVGAVARTKKQAEMNAAKVAWDHLKERNGVCLTKIMQYPGSLSLKCQVNSDDFTCSQRNHVGPINVMDQSNLNSIRISALNIKEDSQALKEKAHHNGEVTVKKMYSEVMDCTSAPVNEPDNEMFPHGYTYPLMPSHLKFDSNGSSVKNVAMTRNVNNLPDSNPNVNRPSDGIFSVSHIDQLDYSLSKPDSDPTVAPEQKSRGTGVSAKKKIYHEDLDSSSATVNESDTEVLSSANLLILSRLKLDSNGSAFKNKNLNKLHDGIFSGDHDGRLNHPLSKRDFDSRIQQEESEDNPSSEVVDVEAIEDISADIPKVGDSPTLLCNRVRVYPRKPDMILPPGATLLPLSDDAWVAVSLDFADHDNSLPIIS